MNIFFLDENPTMSAKYHVDKHVIKMVLEVSQLLCGVHHMTDQVPTKHRPSTDQVPNKYPTSCPIRTILVLFGLVRVYQTTCICVNWDWNLEKNIHTDMVKYINQLM